MRIHMFSLHGLFRARDLEIGRDADNGGQIIYVMELAAALSQHPKIEKVHLFTRRIDDPACSSDYSAPVEIVNEKFDIRRIPCGGKKYLKKEALWPHLDEYVTNAIQYMKAEQILPQWIHSHYADAGYVGAELSAYLNVPFVHSAHSLGIPKLEKLLDAGVTRTESFEKFQFDRRFEAEESVLANSEFVVTSTEREIGLFDDYGNSEFAEYHVLPPGIDFSRFYPYYENLLGESKKSEAEKQAVQMASERMNRFLTDPSKPLILAVCRPDKRKNIDGLLHAYGTDLQLQAVANLAIFAGIRGDISNMAEGARDVLTEILLLMDKYNLYGKLAIPKQHDTEWEVPELYRLAARQKGVFVNVALTEPFGLTILEATACGLPVVATNHGGPAEILPICQNGSLVEPTDTEALQQALRNILIDEEKWQQLSNAGIKNVREHFCWSKHAERYIDLVGLNLENSSGAGIKSGSRNRVVEKRLMTSTRMMITDIDGTLISEEGRYQGLDELKEVLENREDRFVFGVATGRSLDLVREVLEEHRIPKPDVVVSSVGACIYYGLDEETRDKRWQQFISYRWNRENIEELLRDFPGIKLQEAAAQNPYKLSYYVQEEDFGLDKLMERLRTVQSRINVIYSRNAFLDIMPKRSSKGRAVRYLSHKWSIPLKNTVVCGDSGNDLDMFVGSARGVIVANHAPELRDLTLRKQNYFTRGESAAGVLEGLKHFKFI